MGAPLALIRQPAVKLVVTKGAHSGVALPVPAGPLRIGASIKSDIVLSDRDVADDHATLAIDRGRLRIEARGGDVGLGDGHTVPKGQGCRVPLPVEIRIGASAMRLDDENRRAAWLRPPTAAIACVAMLLVVSIAATQAGFTSGEAELHEGAAATPAALEPATPSADPADALREKAASLGVDGLKIEADGDRVVARGAIEDAARPRWAAAQRWFDQTYGGRFVLASEVGMKSAMVKPRFQLQAIWFGASPYVVTSDGQRRYAGANIGDGWVLKDIRENQITVAKAGEEMVLSY